jgi:GntR family transcriptional regulator, transcriptional repressor for pyruvate dehydrogenase complex
MLKAVRKKRAFEDIVKQIRQLIEKGKLKREDQLPTERELSETFKVSRATVREAIFSLETMKLVERRQGDGTYVIASSEEALVQPLAMSLFLDKDDIIDIFSLRKIIEPEIAKLASENRTPEEMNELEEIVRQHERAVKDGLSPIQTNAGFHRLLARASKNRVLERLLLALFGLLRRTREEHLQTEDRKRKSLQGHQEILSAVRSGNGPAARQAMRRHLQGVEDVLFKKRKEVARGRHPEIRSPKP